MKMSTCEDEKMRYRPLLEEPCAQTLSGKKAGQEVCQSKRFGGKTGCRLSHPQNFPVGQQVNDAD